MYLAQNMLPGEYVKVRAIKIYEGNEDYIQNIMKRISMLKKVDVGCFVRMF